MTEKQLNDFMARKFVIHCQTEDEAKKLMEYFDNKGIRWYDRKASSKTKWDEYENETCYAYGRYDKYLYFANTKYYNKKEIIIEKYSNLFPSALTIEVTIKLSNNDVAKYNLIKEKIEIEIDATIKKICGIEKPKFIPHLVSSRTNDNYGNIGESTDIIDMIGNTLKVGDTVMLYHEYKKYGEVTVCKSENSFFIMGVYGINFKNGKSNEWKIIKENSYLHFQHNDRVDDIKYILKEEK